MKEIIKKKPKLKIEFKPKEPPDSIEHILRQIFWKNPELVQTSKEFLSHIKEWGRTDSPYSVKGWENYCTKKGITQSIYHNMLKRLKSAGMVEKVYNKSRGVHELRISEEFSSYVLGMGRVWNEFCRV